MCRRKGAATAAARLSFLSPSDAIPVPGYPNFTPESQYLLITLEGIVLYSLCPSLSRSFSYSHAASLSLPLSTLRTPPSNRDLCTFSRGDEPLLRFFFSFLLSFRFQGKEKHNRRQVDLCRAVKMLAAVLRDTSSPLGRFTREGKKGSSTEGKGNRSSGAAIATPGTSRRDENSPHDSLFLEVCLLCRSRTPHNAIPNSWKFEGVRSLLSTLRGSSICASTPRPK